MDFLKLATDRFSTRDFSTKPVEDEKIEIIKEAARIAPTAKNNQPQVVYLLKSEEALKKQIICDVEKIRSWVKNKLQ